ncbi:hypothetical protein F4811DRAFT_423083 [Daldinia bambusicola]|nr:hypothetical protein F4811DRAFT_423083 [Daldinia bambusicola]
MEIFCCLPSRLLPVGARKLLRGAIDRFSTTMSIPPFPISTLAFLYWLGELIDPLALFKAYPKALCLQYTQFAYGGVSKSNGYIRHEEVEKSLNNVVLHLALRHHHLVNGLRHLASAIPAAPRPGHALGGYYLVAGIRTPRHASDSRGVRVRRPPGPERLPAPVGRVLALHRVVRGRVRERRAWQVSGRRTRRAFRRAGIVPGPAHAVGLRPGQARVVELGV